MVMRRNRRIAIVEEARGEGKFKLAGMEAVADLQRSGIETPNAIET